MFTDEAWRHAIATAREANERTARLVKESAWCGCTIVDHGDGTLRVYQSNAWKRPSEVPMLPWREPSGRPVARVPMGGDVEIIEWVA